MNNIPVNIRLWIHSALVGEIYPEIRVVVAKFTESKKLILRYYLDREPTNFDRDSISMVMTEILANTSSNEEIPKFEEQCVYSNKLLKDLDLLDDIFYARREYEMK